MAEVCQQKWYYDQKLGAVDLKPGDLVLVKADALKGRRKIKDRWEQDTWSSDHNRYPLLQSDGPMWKGMHPLLKTGFFSLHQRLVFPCV